MNGKSRQFTKYTCQRKEQCQTLHHDGMFAALSPCRNAQLCWTPGPKRRQTLLFACMGLVESRVTLDKPFEDVPKWTLPRLRRVLEVYKDRDLDFCVDASVLGLLLGMDALKSTHIVGAFTESPSSQDLNFLSLLSGMAVLCSEDLNKNSVDDKASFVFDCFDLAGMGRIAFDELTILLLSMLRAVVVMVGKGELPSDGESEQLSLRAYDFLDHKETGEPITKKDFLKVVRQLLGSTLPPTSTSTYANASVDDLLIACRLLDAPPPEGYPLFPSAPSPSPSPSPSPHHAPSPSPPQSLLIKHLTRDVFLTLSPRRTPTRNLTLDQLIQSGVDSPLLPVGVSVGDPECYTTFAALLTPMIRDLHGIDPSSSPPQWLDCDSGNLSWDAVPTLDPAYVTWVQASAVRNLVGFAFPPTMHRGERRTVENLLSAACANLANDHERGAYHPLRGASDWDTHPLLRDPFLFKPRGELDRVHPGAVSEWPEGRGSYRAASGALIAIFNSEDHLQVGVGQAGPNLRRAFDRCHNALHAMQRCLEDGDGTSFAFDPQLGYLTTCPSKVGTAMSLSVTARLPELATRQGQLLHSLATRLGLRAEVLKKNSTSNNATTPQPTTQQTTTQTMQQQQQAPVEVRLCNRSLLGHSEVELLESVIVGVHTLVEVEKAAARGDRLRMDALIGAVPRQWAPRTVPNLKQIRMPAPKPHYAPTLVTDAPLFIKDHHTSLLASVLRSTLYEALRSRQTAKGTTLNDVIRAGLEVPGVRAGVLAPDEECYTTFAYLTEPILEKLQGPLPPRAWDVDFTLPPTLATVQAGGPCIKTLRLSLVRNVQGFCFAPRITRGDRRKVEKLLSSVLEGVTGLRYLPLAQMDPAQLSTWRSKGLLFDDPTSEGLLRKCGGARDWPDARGALVNEAKGWAVWVNEEDHIKIVHVSDTGDLGAMASHVFKLCASLEGALQARGHAFARSKRLGALSVSPFNVGTGLRLAVGLVSQTLRNSAKTKARFKADWDLDLSKDAARGPAFYWVKSGRTAGLSESALVQKLAEALVEMVGEVGGVDDGQEPHESGGDGEVEGTRGEGGLPDPNEPPEPPARTNAGEEGRSEEPGPAQGPEGKRIEPTAAEYAALRRQVAAEFAELIVAEGIDHVQKLVHRVSNSGYSDDGEEGKGEGGQPRQKNNRAMAF